MFKKKISILYTISILAIGAGFLTLLFLRMRFVQQTPYAKTIQQRVPTDMVLLAGSLEIPVTIADTPATREQGLSDTSSLPADSGMLFVFDTPSKQGFWMKDMQYPLDFVWIGSDMKIAGITPNVAADTYPQVFFSPQPVQYVLEVNAGFSTAHGLMAGEQLTLQ